MKKLPADTSIENFEYPVYESDHKKQMPHLADIAPAEGFTPFNESGDPQSADPLPVVQNAILQDFKTLKPRES
jgi:hypothetical protein